MFKACKETRIIAMLLTEIDSDNTEAWNFLLALNGLQAALSEAHESMRYKCSRKPKICPACKSACIAKVLYGYPHSSNKLKNDLKEGRVVLGGCCFFAADDPIWRCLSCGTNIHR